MSFEMAKKATRDIVKSLSQYRIWVALAWFEIKLQYRRTLLGPFWITLASLATVAVLGFLFGSLFKQDIKTYLPYLSCGIVFWQFIVTVVTESTAVWANSGATVNQVRIPFFHFIFKHLTRNTIHLLHNMATICLVFIVLNIVPKVEALLFIPGLLIAIWFCVWVSAIVGLLCLRFRDLAMAIGVFMNVLFFVTPIMWYPSQLAEQHQFLVYFNPIYLVVSVMRDPLLGVCPSELTWYIILGLNVLGSVIGFALFSRFRSRMFYWL